MNARLALLLLSTVLVFPLAAVSYFEEGERLLREDNPQESVIYLEEALNENPSEETVYMYLGIIYEQLNDPEKAISIMRRGLNVATEIKDILYLNIGNNYFKLEEFMLAEENYTRATDANSYNASAYLNRANTRMKLYNYRGALADYSITLTLNPDNAQRPQIEQIIKLLSDKIDAEEAKQREELRRQKALMNEVINSLKNASENTKNLSAGSEEIEESYDEVDIED